MHYLNRIPRIVIFFEEFHPLNMVAVEEVMIIL